MEHAAPVHVPESLRPLNHLGFWIKSPTFPFWPIDLVPFLDTNHHEQDESGASSDSFDWHGTWGHAAFEAHMLEKTIDYERSQRKLRADLDAQRDHSVPLSEHERNLRQQDAILHEGDKPLFAALKALIERAGIEGAETPIDAEALSEIINQRNTLAESLPIETILKERLIKPDRSDANALMNYFDREKGEFRDVPSVFHPIFTRWITRNRRHRLFGLAQPYVTGYVDLRGLDCLLKLDTDPFLATQTEHESGFSIWADREEMAQGRFENGRVIWHTNV
ncbi:MAG: hypothetical protein ABJF50_19185 [Paracoccaceae bacterium]